MTVVLLIKRRYTEAHTEREESHMMSEAETGGKQLQAKQSQRLPEAIRS